jgi:LuxR family transcriptional regulator, regulator of acetate metabolism
MSLPATGEVFRGPLGAQLHDRLVGATAEAQRLLGDGPAPGEAGASDRLRSSIDALTDRLARASGGDPAPAVGEHQDALERLRQRFEARFGALARVHEAIGELREITSPASMLARAPAALCDASKLQRALISLVGGGRMVAQAAHFAGDGAGADAVLEQLRAHPIRLEHPLIETELLRRRRATIVVGASVHPRVDPRLVQLMGWDSYAAAPLVAGGKVIGVLHADRGRDSKLDVLDRDVLWEFTSELAQAYESASLRRTLRHEREQMRQFLDWLGARSSELTDAPIRLATVQRPPPPLSAAEPPLPPAGRDDRVVFEGLLTRRELDVLRLLADGNTNKAIAGALVISDGTVKFHVNSILRKLRVSNRAQAVSRYLRLLGMQSP